jgi:hypothetical protein
VLPPVAATVVAPNGVPLHVEWAEFFAQGIYSILLPLFLQVSSGKVSFSLVSLKKESFLKITDRNTFFQGREQFNLY